MYYVYILHLSNGNYYKGSTGDLRRRIDQHKKGLSPATKPYRPVKLIHYEAYVLKSDAERREKFLKTTEGKRLLKKQLRDILQQKDMGL